MFPARRRTSPKPLHSRHRLLCWLAGLALVADYGHAQIQAAPAQTVKQGSITSEFTSGAKAHVDFAGFAARLKSCPDTDQRFSVECNAPADFIAVSTGAEAPAYRTYEAAFASTLMDGQHGSVERPSGAATPPPPATQEGPIVTMAPYHSNGRYWLSGQANIIFQGNLPFHSPYEGTNSLQSGAEYKTSLLGTLYTALRPTRSIRYNTDLIFDMESAGGRGLSQALGLAGFTNLDVVRNPTLSTLPYMARYQIHQVIGLTQKTASQVPGFFALAPSVPVRRVEFRLGKMTLPDFFDVNTPGSDSHLQFMNWTVDNNGVWDYAANTRGYTVGGMAEYDDRKWSLRYGLFAMPTVANGMDLDWDWRRSHGHNGEFELRHSFIAQRKGAERLLFYANRAHMGSYREAVNAYLAGTDAKPNIQLHEHYGALKYGFGYNTEQELTENLRVFGRFGWNEGQHESFAYTEVDQTVEAGGDYAGVRWHRPADKIGLAVVTNAIKRDHQNYLKLGGLGFLLGDGKLNYGRESIVESYYNWHAWRGLFYAVDVQHINNPGYNRDRGPVWVGSVRAHVDF